MWLIDVRDFIKNKLSKYDLPSDSINACDIRLMLLEQPTVEAIPTEWIINYYHEAVSLATNYGNNEMQQAFGVMNMLDDWRKENEQKCNSR